MRAVGDKRTAWAWLELRALARIDFHVPARDCAGVRNAYLTLCQVAAIELDGNHDGFEASRKVLMAHGRISENTLDKHLGTLQRLGLVEVETRTAGNGAGLPNRYVLVDSPAADAPATPDPTATIAPPATAARGVANAQPLPPQRARVDGWKKEEEEREGESAGEHADDQDQGGTPAPNESAVVAALTPLLEQRGQTLTLHDQLNIRAALNAPPVAGVDVVAAAGRLATNYGPDGKAGRRPIVNIGGLLAAELSNSTAARESEGTERARRGRRRRGAVEPTRSAASLANVLRVHHALPAATEAPWPQLTAAWEQMRDVLRQSVPQSTWGIYLESLQLAGCLTVTTEDAGGERSHRVLMLTADEDYATWVAGRFGGLIAEATGRTFGPTVSVELVVRPAGSDVRAVPTTPEEEPA